MNSNEEADGSGSKGQDLCKKWKRLARGTVRDLSTKSSSGKTQSAC